MRSGATQRSSPASGSRCCSDVGREIGSTRRVPLADTNCVSPARGPTKRTATPPGARGSRVAEFQSLTNYLTGNNDFYIAPEIGYSSKGTTAYIKPGVGIDPDANDRQWGIEFGFREVHEPPAPCETFEMYRPHALALALALALWAPGCAFGPKALERTHGQYGAAVQRVEEEQFLKNIVRLRYVEAPRNLDVAAIAAQYELSAGAEARPFFSTESVSGPFFRSFSRVLPFGSVSGSNRPTVTLDPQDDGITVRQFLTPISADTLVFLGQSGWPISSVLRIWVDRLNGVPNRVPASGPPRNTTTDFERFRRATELMQIMQDQELVSVKAEERTLVLSDPLPPEAVNGSAVAQATKDGYEFRQRGGKWVIVKTSRQLVLDVGASAKSAPELAEFRSLLNLQPGAQRYDLTVASGVTDPAKEREEPTNALRVTPRSTAQALFFLANGVEIPAAHVACGLVHLPPDGVDPGEATRGVFRVRSCPGHPRKPPACAYVTVWYRDHWFYVDDRDQESKATLILMLQLRRLDFQRQRLESAPALTLPIGR